jgi:hypothetical protein
MIKKIKSKTQEKIKNRKKTVVVTIILLLFGCWYFIFYQGFNSAEIIEGTAFENQDKIQLESELQAMVKGYPIEIMIPYIIEEDQKIVAFVVGIAKKESNWGKNVPVLNGEDCYNYWGYRGGGERASAGGYTCFSTPKEAVGRISKRIANLVEKQNLQSPQDMIVWKCGSSCKGHSNSGVQKWISDVNLYFQKIVKM